MAKKTKKLKLTPAVVFDKAKHLAKGRCLGPGLEYWCGVRDAAGLLSGAWGDDIFLARFLRGEPGLIGDESDPYLADKQAHHL